MPRNHQTAPPGCSRAAQPLLRLQAPWATWVSVPSVCRAWRGWEDQPECQGTQGAYRTDETPTRVRTAHVLRACVQSPSIAASSIAIRGGSCGYTSVSSSCCCAPPLVCWNLRRGTHTPDTPTSLPPAVTWCVIVLYTLLGVLSRGRTASIGLLAVTSVGGGRVGGGQGETLSNATMWCSAAMLPVRRCRLPTTSSPHPMI